MRGFKGVLCSSSQIWNTYWAAPNQNWTIIAMFELPRNISDTRKVLWSKRGLIHMRTKGLCHPALLKVWSMFVFSSLDLKHFCFSTVLWFHAFFVLFFCTICVFGACLVSFSASCSSFSPMQLFFPLQFMLKFCVFVISPDNDRLSCCASSALVGHSSLPQLPASSWVLTLYWEGTVSHQHFYVDF